MTPRGTAAAGAATAAVERVRTGVGDDEAWRVSDHASVRMLLGDRRLGHAHPDPQNAARSSESAILGGPMGDFETEPAEHARARALLLPLFSARRMHRLRPRIEALTTDLLDALLAGDCPADLIAAVAGPLPILVICELLGVPYADRDRFREWTAAVGAATDPGRSEQSMAALYEYGLGLVNAKRRAPVDDVISGMCTDKTLGDAEVAAYAMQLLFAGHETMIAQIGLGALHLLDDREQWAALVAAPALIDSTVEEILRAPGTAGGGIPRYARTDLTVGGVVICAGDLLLLDIAAANHDPAVFADPDRFDISRGAGNHLTFGQGMNYCMGARLARIELEVVFSLLAQRFPAMRLAVPAADIRRQTDRLTAGPVTLPVTW